MAFLLTVFSNLLELASYVYDALVFVPWYLFDNHKEVIRLSREIKARPVVENDPSSPYRSMIALKNLANTPIPNCFTINELFDNAVERFSNVTTLGTREMLHEEDEVQPNGKVFKKAIYGDYKWITYKDLKVHVDNFSCGLVQLGNISSICIFAETCSGWLASALACFKCNIPLTTLYATLGEEAIIHGLKETESNVLITGASGVLKFKNMIKHLPKLKYIIYLDGIFSNNQKKLNFDKFDGSDVKIISWSLVEANGSKVKNKSECLTRRAPKPSDLAVIMYTSGSTGQPKGVMLSHSNIVCSLAAFKACVEDVGPSDVIAAYLPLAHMLELAVELLCLITGVRIGYSSAATLNDQSTKIKKGNKGDISVLQPTLLAIVPVMMDRMYKVVWDKINSGNGLKKAIFNFAYNYKKKWRAAGYRTPLIDRLIFKRLRSAVGDKVRMMVSGGAPLSSSSQEFMNLCFCCPVLQGYGLTETSGAGSIQMRQDKMVGHVGRPLSCCEIKLVDWDEGGYHPTDLPHPRGEVWISGGCVSMGYYKNPEKTAESFIVVDGKRWFATGDIGQMETDGCLKIIDRKKDLVKLQAGEYVSLGKVETVLNLSPYVDNICLCADPTKNFTVALVLPYRKNLFQLGSELGLIKNGESESTWLKLLDNKDVLDHIVKNLKEVAAQGNLEKFEIPTGIKLVKELWTPDAGFLTEAYKLKRKFIENFYKNDIIKLYS